LHPASCTESKMESIIFMAGNFMTSQFALNSSKIGP
jgi:hypothetical protein